MTGSDPSLLTFDRVSMLAPVLLIFVTCLTVFHRLKVRWPVTVNCWFCNKNSKIWRKDLNWWLCPWCEQYNGFSKNDDYTYNIPEQYATPNMSTRYCRLIKQSNSRNISMNHLCANCNKQENLKLLELSNFEPKSERHYNAELTKFKEYLEKRYPLCNNCKLTVQTVLNKQALWLTRYKMLFFRQKPIKMLIGNTRKLEVLFRGMSTILFLIPIIVYNHDSVWLPIGGLFFHLCACWANSKKKRLDILLIFLWFCIISFVYIKNSIFQNVWLMMDIVHCLIQVCAFITGFLSINLISHKNTLIGSVAFKKLKLHPRNVAPQSTLQNHSESKINTSNEIINAVESSVYVTGEVSSTEIKSHSAILRQKLSTVADNNNDNHLNSVSQNNNSLLDGCCLNHSLSTLFLSEDSSRYGKNPTKATPAIFERKIYSTTSSENLFKKFGSGNRRYILSPPKLRSVTQTSWVAGGYWQEGHMMTATPPTLSRSSSQSSGFGSAGSSNFAPSREPSVHEFDRCSIVSDATRWSYHASRANHSSRIEEQENYVREANVGSPKDLTPAFPDHRTMTTTTTTTTTIVASSGWLSALLCGSLILNMIVLCATLLR
ncbi:hypothetical protein CAJAP_08532 [Camponotus japonicus]